jgi:hypothetical protein
MVTGSRQVVAGGQPGQPAPDDDDALGLHRGWPSVPIGPRPGRYLHRALFSCPVGGRSTGNAGVTLSLRSSASGARAGSPGRVSPT